MKFGGEVRFASSNGFDAFNVIPAYFSVSEMNSMSRRQQFYIFPVWVPTKEQRRITAGRI